MRSTVERELKLDLDPEFALPALPGDSLPGRLFTSTYHDTPARSLGRAGITLRRRVENGKSLWQLKLPRQSGNGGLERKELEEPGGPAGPPDDLARLLVGHLRHGKLGPVATLRTRRSGICVLDGERRIAEVTIDKVDILDAGRSAGGFSELEVELVDGDERDLERLGKTLRRAGAQRSDGAPKLMRVLELEPHVAPATDAPLSDHLRFILGVQLRELEGHDPGVRLGEDAEDVHRFRVATRRTRALIRATRPVLGEVLTPLADELKWLGGMFGPVRDLDVLLDRLGAEVERLDDDEPAGRQLLAGLEEERDRDRERLLDALASDRYRSVLETFEEAIRTLPPLAGDGAADRVARDEFRRLRKAVAALPRNPTDDALHEIRIDAKRARYAAELAALGGGKAALRAVEALKGVQDTIGEHQDAVVAEARLRKLARAKTAIAAGRLVERERKRRRATRAAYPDVVSAALEVGQEGVRVILVRHASAGDAATWAGPDRERPLDRRGEHQARQLVELLARFPVAEIHTSPAVRCVETIRPLAAARGIELVARDELGEDRYGSEGAAVVESLAGSDAVICGHGGLESLARRCAEVAQGRGVRRRRLAPDRREAAALSGGRGLLGGQREQRAVAKPGADHLERRAEMVLETGDDDGAGRERPCAVLADAVALRDLRGGRVGEQREQMIELVDADAAADDPLQRAGAAADGERRADRGSVPAVEVPLDLGAGSPDRSGAGRVLGEHAARQSLRAEVDRPRPLGAVVPGADDDLRRTAAHVDDGDRAPRRDLASRTARRRTRDTPPRPR